MANTDPFLLRKETGFISRCLGNSHPAMANITQTGREKAEYSPVLLSSDLIQHSLLLP